MTTPKKRNLNLDSKSFANHKEYKRAYMKVYSKKFSDEYKEQQKRQYEKNTEKRKEYQKQYDRKNRIQIYQRNNERNYMNRYGKVMSDFVYYLDSL